MASLLSQISEPEYELVDVAQGSDEWLDLRKKCIGASDIPIIMGVNPHCSAYDLWLKKTGRKSEDPSNFMMQRGHDLEPVGRERAEKRLGVSLPSVTGMRSDIPWAIASLDGFNADARIILEVKAPHRTNYAKIEKLDILPELYVYQAQWQMYVFGMDAVSFEFTTDVESFSRTVIRDNELIAVLIKAAKEFRGLVLNDIEPLCLLPKAKDRLFIDTPEKGDLMQRAMATKPLLDKLKEEWDGIRQEILDLTDGGECEGEFFTVTYSKGRETMNYKKLVSDLNLSEEVLSKYREVGVSQPRVTLKD